MKNLVFLMCACLAFTGSFAQTQSDQYYRNNPVWIEMMEQENVHFLTAVKAFDLYWEHREKPATEHELFSASEEEKEKTDFVRSKQKKQEAEAVRYAFEYRKFLRWQQKVQSYLNADGTVMNAAQRIGQWQKQLENRK
ncbi:MAG: hypothetical protein IT257_11790 [Chitinophagaceae bacterium]|nr:hypothetical protein [Chitinophagaceae bacterium]